MSETTSNALAEEPASTAAVVQLSNAPQNRGRPWVKGQSGNPRGRPLRTYATAERIRAALVDELPQILEKIIADAKRGDPQARRLVVEYTLSKPRPSEAPVLMDPLTGSLPEQAQQLLDAMAQGRLSPDQCSKLLVGLGAVAHAAEVDAITNRLKTIEHALEHRDGQTS